MIITTSTDPGYDWFAPSVQGEAILTPEIERIADEILAQYDHEDGVTVGPRGRADGVLAVLTRLFGRRQKSIRLTLPD